MNSNPSLFFFCLRSVPATLDYRWKKPWKCFAWKKRKKEKEKSLVSLLSLAQEDIYIYSVYIVICHNAMNRWNSVSANLMDGRRTRCKKRGRKNWRRLVASDGTISINRTNRGRRNGEEVRGGGIEGVYRLIDGCCPIEITGAYLPG